MGVEIKDSPVSPAAFEEMETFVRDYLAASVESEDDGGRHHGSHVATGGVRADEPTDHEHDRRHY